MKWKVGDLLTPKDYCDPYDGPGSRDRLHHGDAILVLELELRTATGQHLTVLTKFGKRSVHSTWFERV